MASGDDLITAPHVLMADRLAAAFARRTPPGTDRGNIIGCAQEALVRAARAFDPSKGIEFEHYAGQRIWWALHEEARRQTLLSRRHISAIRAGETFAPQGRPQPHVRVVSFDELQQVSPELGGSREAPSVDVIDRRDRLKALSPRERFVLLAGGYGYTQKEIGRMLGISSGRVADIQGFALQKAAGNVGT